MTDRSTCPNCGTATVDGICNHCGTGGDEQLQDTRRKLVATREQLSDWRERVARRLEEIERKRETLGSQSARRAAVAPTLRLDETESVPEPEPVEPVDPHRTPTRRLAPREAERAAEASEPWDDEPPTGWLHTPMVAPSRRIDEDDAAGPLPSPHLPEAYVVETPLDMTETEAPSLVRHLASLVLDTLLLLALPGAVLFAPLTAMLGAGLGSLWQDSPRLLGTIAWFVFVCLQAAYVGAYGRTPGQRLTGIRVVTISGQIPSFVQAALRGILFPLLLLPAVHRLAGLTTVNDA